MPDAYKALYEYEHDFPRPNTIDDAGVLNLADSVTGKRPLETVPMLVSTDKGKKMSVDSSNQNGNMFLDLPEGVAHMRVLALMTRAGNAMFF